MRRWLIKRSLIPFRTNERENGNKGRRCHGLGFIVIQETAGRRAIVRRKLARNEANQIGWLRNVRSLTISCNKLDKVSKVKRLPHFLFPVLSYIFTMFLCHLDYRGNIFLSIYRYSAIQKNFRIFLLIVRINLSYLINVKYCTQSDLYWINKIL